MLREEPGDVAVFGRLVSLLAWSKFPNDASKPVYIVAGGRVGDEFPGDHTGFAANHLCW